MALRKLKTLRGAASLESVAHDVGISTSQLSRYENGERDPYLKHLRALAERFGVSVSEIIDEPAPTKVPLVSWVSAGMLRASHPVYERDILRTVHVADLPAGDWIALEIDGDSMDRVAPPGAIILVDRADHDLVDGRFYVFGNQDTGEATFKRYRSKPDRLQPFSTNPDHESHYVNSEVQVVGRVRQVITFV